MNIVLTVIAVVVVVGIAVFIWRSSRRRALQRQFGPEYDRTLADRGNRGAAESELRARRERHDELELKEIDPAQREKFMGDWTDLQATFVDNPGGTVGAADEFIARVMSARGYPTGGYDDRISTLSVEHGRVLDHYRYAHDVSLANERGAATTEQLRQALVHYRSLVADLLGDHPAPADDPAANHYAKGTHS